MTEYIINEENSRMIRHNLYQALGDSISWVTTEILDENTYLLVTLDAKSFPSSEKVKEAMDTAVMVVEKILPNTGNDFTWMIKLNTQDELPKDSNYPVHSVVVGGKRR